MTATDPHTTPIQPAGPPPRKHGYGLIALILAACLCLAAAVTASWLALTSGHHPAPAPRPADTLFSPSATTAVDPMAAWCAGPGNAALGHVRADLNQVGADARSQDLAAAEADGGRLTADAEAAEALPPPVTQAQKLNYVKAMGALSFAGIDLSAGNLTAANRAISAASGYLSQDAGIITC
jgi:hypothetical protein